MRQMILRIFFQDVLNYLYELEQKISVKKEEIITLKEELDLKPKTITKIKEIEVPQITTTELELYCKEHYEEVPKFAYRDKRYSVKNIFIDMYPNELIRNNVFEIDRVRGRIAKNNDNYVWFSRVGNYVAQNMRWVSDPETYNVVDFYSYPAETLKLGYSDCESHAGIVSSIEPEIGIAFGNANGTWHAWNVFIYNGELFHLETNASNRNLTRCIIFKDTEQGSNAYNMNWIFTANKTFKVNDSVHFGVIAN